MKLILSFVYLFIGTAMFALPNLTRRGILFGVSVPQHFRETPTAQRSVTIFRAVVGIVVLAALCALLLSPETLLGPVAAAGPLAIILAGGLGFCAKSQTCAVCR